MILKRFLKVWRTGDKFWPKFTLQKTKIQILDVLKQANKLSHLGITQHF